MNNIDRHIGSRVRLRRKILNISQYALAFDLEISFQQLQKYESGENRISASRLYEISKILNVSPHFFFEGLEGVLLNENEPKDFKSLKVVHMMTKIKNQKIKDKIIDLIEELNS